MRRRVVLATCGLELLRQEPGFLALARRQTFGARRTAAPRCGFRPLARLGRRGGCGRSGRLRQDEPRRCEGGRQDGWSDCQRRGGRFVFGLVEFLVEALLQELEHDFAGVGARPDAVTREVDVELGDAECESFLDGLRAHALANYDFAIVVEAVLDERDQLVGVLRPLRRDDADLAQMAAQREGPPIGTTATPAAPNRSQRTA